MTVEQLPKITILALMPQGPAADILLQILTRSGAGRVVHVQSVELAERWLDTQPADVVLVGRELADDTAAQALIERTGLPAIGYGGAPLANAPRHFAAWLPGGVELVDAVRAIRQVWERRP